jgi:beta-lactamase class A
MLLNKQIPFLYLVATALLSGGGTFLAYNTFKKPVEQPSNDVAYTTSGTPVCNYQLKRLDGFSYVRPLLYTEKECESDKLAFLKQDVNNMVEYQKKIDNISSASVYVRILSKGDWTAINADEPCHPASLIKVPVMMAYLRMAETDPNLLDKKILFENHFGNLPEQAFKYEPLQPGHNYTVRELLHFLIAYSDNDASTLLFRNINMDLYNRVFTDLGIAAPPPNFSDLRITAKQYSEFFMVLYNATYLTIPSSEYATLLLSECAFSDGIIKKLPPTTKIAHKFGEWGDGVTHELHESAIVYLNNQPYLITIMTKGKYFNKLSEAMSDISKLVYDKMTEGNSSQS